jgi:hypothetical protein
MESGIQLSRNDSRPEVVFAQNAYIMCFFFVYAVHRLKFGNRD